ncbi:ferric-rhodotorulic acid/ferric-coprogen receptor FhuE [Acinetobacter venetianus]|jgi:outer membrane receptor for ferric coprogen and ferric-rhodotorulic acid|uniref:ferric-rhodotorulic acid/ferric-coprogen receptor FhuE n=1 Tax=Acinetobacter venetianus TaxID=52133 RepID=UPI000AF2F106
MHKHPSRQVFKTHPLVLAMAVLLPSVAYAESSTESTAQLPTIKIQAESENLKQAYTVEKSSTALPLNLTLKEIPQSVSVVTQQRMQDQGLTTLVEVAENVTGITVNRYETNRGGLYSRGFVVDNYIIDGIPTTYSLPWSSGEIFSSTAIYDHIEVVRGATGLTTGAGNPSAAINMARKRAASKEPAANIEVSGGSWNNYRVMGDIANSLNDSGSLRGRAVAQYEQGDSFTDLLSKERLTLLLTGEADLTESTLLSAGVSYQEDDPRGPMWGGLPVFFSDGSRTHLSKSATTTQDWTRWNVKYTNWFADLTQKINDDWSVKLSYAHGNREAESKLFYVSGNPDKTTGLGLSGFAGSYKVNVDQDNITLQTDGVFNLFGRDHKAVVGYQYSNQEFEALGRSGTTEAVGSIYDWNASLPEPIWSAWTPSESYTVKQNAIFAATQLSLLDPLKLIIGGRVTDYEKDLGSTASKIKYEHEFIPYAGLIYDINQNYSAYASYTSIFQPQDQRDFNNNYLDPIKGNSTEIGLKSSWFDNRLNGSLALFDIKQDNLAQAVGQIQRPNGTLETYYKAAKGAESKGFELEVSGQVTPNWNVTAGYSQYKATDVNDADINTQLPRKLIQTYTSYQLPGKWSDLSIGGGVNWQSDTYVIASNAPAGANPRIEQGSYALVNLMAKYKINKDFSAQLNVNNVFDKGYYGVFPAYGQITQGAPRNATLTLRYQF